MRYVERIQTEDEGKIREVEKTSKRRAQLLGHIEQAGKTLSEQIEVPLTREEQAIQEACTEEGGFNAPMLVAWLLKHVHEEPTTLNGLKFLLKHMASGEGCFLMHRHGVLHAITKIHDFYHSQPPIQLMVVSILKQLLDCNYTRSAMIAQVDVLNMAFSIAHTYMNSASHVEACCHCITQCTRSETCRLAILRQNIPAYMIHFCKKYSKNAQIIRSTLLLFTWITTDQARLEYVCSIHGVNTAIQCIKRHTNNSKVLSPAILFLSRAVQQHPPSMALILKKNAAALIIQALKVVYGDDALQLAGLKLLQIISRTSVGWKQISEVDAGWQSITQGTVHGDALVHDLPGAFKNPGKHPDFPVYPFNSFLICTQNLYFNPFHTLIYILYICDYCYYHVRLECGRHPIPALPGPAEAVCRQAGPVRDPARNPRCLDVLLAAGVHGAVDGRADPGDQYRTPYCVLRATLYTRHVTQAW